MKSPSAVQSRKSYNSRPWQFANLMDRLIVVNRGDLFTQCDFSFLSSICERCTVRFRPVRAPA